MLLEQNSNGLYCPAGDFYVDPNRRVKRAVVTHAHSDHACRGCERYLAVDESKHLLRMRLGVSAQIRTLPYGETYDVGGVRVSLHPAGHMLGASQVRIEHKGEVAVVSGDYKLGADATCASWEPIKCNLFVSESTFCLPIYQWRPQEEVFEQINRWWRLNSARGICSVLYGYAIGKSQRLLAGLAPSNGPIFTDEKIEQGVQAYRKTGVNLPVTRALDSATAGELAEGIVLAVSNIREAEFFRNNASHASRNGQGLPPISTAMASGWMQTSSTRKGRRADRGFVLSDHVDWPEFLKAVSLCEAEEVWVTHGYSEIAARYLREQMGLNAISLDTKRGAGLNASGNEGDTDSEAAVT